MDIGFNKAKSVLSEYSCVLFDFDGTLFDTMNDNYNAWRHVLSSYGISINKQEYLITEGLTPEAIVKRFGNLNDADLIKKIINDKDVFYIQNNNSKVYDGAVPLLEKLKKGGKGIALVTGGSTMRIMYLLEKYKLSDYFDVIVSAEDVKNPKPNPEPYKIAMSRIQKIKAGMCIVIENAPFGIEAAKRAGLYCIGIASTLGIEHLYMADKIVSNIADLNSYL